MTRTPVVLFLCTHNAGRSLAARVLLDHYAKGRIDVRSAGSEPADQLNPIVVAVLEERGLDLTGDHPKPLTTSDGLAADVIVTVGCGDACPVYPGKRYVDWDLVDPAGQPIEVVRPIVDDIDRRVRALLAELTGPDLEIHPDRRSIPVACTLDQTEGTQRIDQWRRTLHGLVAGAERPWPGQLRLALADDGDGVAALVALAREEKRCCPFFDFTLDIGADVATFVIDVPAGSEDILDDFARFAATP